MLYSDTERDFDENKRFSPGFFYSTASHGRPQYKVISFLPVNKNKHQVSFCMKISQAKNHQTDEKGILKARSFFAQLRKIRPHEEHPGFSCGRKFCILLQTKNCLAESDFRFMRFLCIRNTESRINIHRFVYPHV